MKTYRLLLVLCAAWPALSASASDDWLDRVGERLQGNSADGFWRARLSGAVDLEGHYVSTPVADLISSDEEWLFAPRLSLNLDVQAGSRAYLFAQMRADRGFDPADRPVEVRLDEYALRLELLDHGRLNVQVGKFATVVGNWVARHDSWRNPFITAPLPYENLTGIWDFKPAPSTPKLLEWSHVQPASDAYRMLTDKANRLPVIWGPAYAHGVSVSGTWGKFNGAVELKTASLASHPAEWKRAGLGGRRPSLGARAGYRPNEMWDLGISFSEGEYLNRAAAGALIPAGFNRHDYRERVTAADVGFAWHRFQFWAEVFAAKFEIPPVGDVSTVAYYFEAKYKFTPQFFGAVRWNQQLYDDVPNAAGVAHGWARAVWRLDIAPTYRISAHTQLKLQYSLRHENPAPENYSQSVAAQITVRF